MSNSCRKCLVPLIAMLGIVASGLLGAGAASAGTNGQHIIYYGGSSYGQCTAGLNQNSETVRNCTQLHTGSNPDSNYWWVGTVKINWYYPNDTYVQTGCDVPKQQDGGDYVTCHDPM